MAFYCLFDSGNIIFAAALKGAGDTRFVMLLTVILSWVIVVFPSWWAMEYGYGVYVAWAFATAYVCILAIVFLLRFLAGKWKTMRVIDVMPPKVLPKMPQVPTADLSRGPRGSCPGKVGQFNMEADPSTSLGVGIYFPSHFLVTQELTPQFILCAIVYSIIDL